MMSDNWGGLHCGLCIQRKEALNELAEWLRGIRRRKKEVESSFFKKTRRYK
jgi:hypothetical protein